jgi:hypothetical protein
VTSYSAQQMYAALRAQGYSKAAAAGIMANMAYESGGQNPLGPYDTSAVGDGGTSHGLLQWNTAGGGYQNMAGTNLSAQIKYMGQTLPSQCTSMTTPAAVAGCLAMRFERCQGCTTTSGAQYQDRVAAAQVISQQPWYTADNAGAGGAQLASMMANSPYAAASNGAAAAAAGATPTLTSAPSQSATASGGGAPNDSGACQPCTGAISQGHGPSPLFGGPILSNRCCIIANPLTVGQSCIFSKTNARALVGGLVILGGLIVTITGVILLFRQSGLSSGGGMGQAASRAGEFMAIFPPAEEAGIAASAMGNRVNRVAAARQSRRRTRTQRTREERYQRRAGIQPAGGYRYTEPAP